MAPAVFMVLLLLVTVPLLMTLQKPARIFEYPFFMAFAFAAFIVPQAVALIRFPGFVQDESVTAVLVMCCLCMAGCFLGYRLAPSAAMLNYASRPIDHRRLFQVGLAFIGCGYAMMYALSTTQVEYSAENGGMTGAGTILLFFGQLAYPGFAIALFCALRKPSLGSIAAALIGVVPLIEQAIIGGRENTATLALTIVMSLFYEYQRQPSRLAIFLGLFIVMVGIPATTEYREHAGNNDWDAVFQMSPVENFKHFINDESTLELRNGAAVIEETAQNGDYQLGKGYWNQIIFRFVPAQWVGVGVKQTLSFDTFDAAAEGRTAGGIQFTRGSTITGMADSFVQFGWLGWLFFVFMGVLFKGMWTASLAPNALFARLLYVMTFSSGMRAVTHWTADFLPGTLYYVIFLGLASLYAAVPRPRAAPYQLSSEASRG